ncbi:MAG: rod shape-determining protein MreC [Candidatus Aminicenantes bacterium RBG_16_63_16]|nr:MAG: rod shape-determining protein MreC [Candidatus Aminicenantes bacterium RBG_16_63_16]
MKEKRKLAVFCGLIFLHLVLISAQVPKGGQATYLEKALFAVFSPVGSLAAGVVGRLKSVWSGYFYLRNVELQNQKMRDELFHLREENLILKHKVLEFQGERDLRALLDTASRAILAASVIGIDPSQYHKSVVLNRGSSDGVKKDMVVLDRHGRLVGRVIDVIAPGQSKVQLITDEESGVGVISARTRVMGVLSGDAEGRCLFRYVLKTNKDIALDEDVLTSGFDDIYPAGLPVGRIAAVGEDASLFKKIVVKPHFDFADLDRVAVFTADLRDRW